MPSSRFGRIAPLSSDPTKQQRPGHQRNTSWATSCSNTGSASSEDTTPRLLASKSSDSTLSTIHKPSTTIMVSSTSEVVGLDSASTGSGRRNSKTTSSSRQKSRRSNSDIPNTVEAASYYGSTPPPRPYPPYYGGPTTMSAVPPYNSYSSSQQYNPHGMSGPPPLAGRKERSWSIEESTPLISQSERPFRSRHDHRRSKSGSAAVPAMADFFSQPERPQASSQQQRSRSENFSPRDEIRRFLPGSSRHQHRRTHSGGSGSFYSYQHSGMPPPPPLAGYYDPRVIAPYSPLGSNEEMLMHPLSAGSSRQHGSIRTAMRKTHLRQQSVQVFMESTKGVEQRSACRNVLFLLLFVFHLVFIGYLGMLYGEEALKAHPDTTEVTILYKNFLLLAWAGGLFAVVLSIVLLANMMYFARNFIQVALVLVIVLSFVWGTAGIGLSPRNVVPVTGVIALALAIAYSFIVWDRIPFAAANLLTALSGIRDFPGTIFITFSLQLLLLGWSIYYSLVVCGIYDALKEHKWDVSERVEIAIYVTLALSLGWTLQVMQGTVQAITGGVIYGWWHNRQNDALVREVTFKTVFYSLGSICFGSLFVGPVRVLRLFSDIFRPSSEETASLMSLHEFMHNVKSCIFPVIESITSRFSPWAYTYVGMFHYGFLDSGAKSTELFEMRGWTTIVSDDLVTNVFFLTSLVIGGVTGCFTYFLSQAESLRVTPGDNPPGLITFAEGALIGLILPSLIFSVIVGAMNAVLVCFASSPVDFEMNHPSLSAEMRHAWREVWPEALDTCGDTRPKHSLYVPFAETASVPSSGSYEDHPLL